MEPKQIFASGFLSDVEVIVGNEIIKAHKYVLATHSDFFARKFQHNPTDTKVVLSQSEIDGSTRFKDLMSCIHFFYDCETLRFDDSENIVGLLACASYLSSKSVFTKCVSKCIEWGIIGEIYPLVEAYDRDRILEDLAVEFYKWNMTKELASTLITSGACKRLIPRVFDQNLWVESSQERRAIFEIVYPERQTINDPQYNETFRSNLFDGLFTFCVQLQTRIGAISRSAQFNGSLWRFECVKAKRDDNREMLSFKMRRETSDDFPDTKNIKISYSILVNREGELFHREHATPILYEVGKSVADFIAPVEDKLIKIIVHVTHLERVA